ncbi:uncharacterized protein IL334_000646 [Kwoniella shivajii]|uniref:BTB domain-containing protein n=1 Tax=Kwoniella shivajii TaxID=564305 RepID=A0ABZ1CPW6_9TREE|nr:hypothetical protein IL334_000646 [Kwoniella shivajii]
MEDSTVHTIEADSSPEYHPSFTEGDIVIVANDKTHFAEDCKRLARGSKVFQDLLALPQPAWDIDGKDIKCSTTIKHGRSFEIDASAELTGYFLSFLGAKIPLLPPTSFTETAKLLYLCNKFDCIQEHTQLVRQRLQGESEGRQWELLNLASDMNDAKLCAMALRKMTKIDFIRGADSGGIAYSYSTVRVSKLASPSFRGHGREDFIT